MPVAPVDQGIVTDLIELLDRESAVQITLTSTALSESSALDALLAGTADIALVSNNQPFRKGITTVMPLYPTVLHIAYRKDAKVADAGLEIRGAKVFAGIPGSASRLMFNRIIARIGLGEDDFTYVDLDTEAPDIVIVFAPISPDRLAEYPELRLWSIAAQGDVGQGSRVDAAVLLNPTLRPFVIPLGTYGDATPEPIFTVAVDKMMVAREDLDESAVYDLINEMQRLRPALSAQRPGLFQEFSDDFGAGRSTFVLHAGALAYLHRSAPSIYERYSGIAEVAVTVLIALISLVIAAVRIFRFRRKTRIDTFYSETIRLRNSVNRQSGEEERAKVREEIRSLQNTAFDLLVHEKLAADESFRIFITLSNDALEQLG
jgi:TRAP-type uncharacterized transport system substrate-binding protein